jgi:hypothetical protein
MVEIDMFYALNPAISAEQELPQTACIQLGETPIRADFSMQ